jgi:trehalose-6-phosphate synthase
MSIEERRQRHAALFRAISDNDVHAWGQRFLIALEQNNVLPATTLPFGPEDRIYPSPVFAGATPLMADRPALAGGDQAA